MSPAILWERVRCVSTEIIYPVYPKGQEVTQRPAPAAHCSSLLSITNHPVAAGWPPACEERGELAPSLRCGFGLAAGRETAVCCSAGDYKLGVECGVGGRAGTE